MKEVRAVFMLKEGGLVEAADPIKRMAGGRAALGSGMGYLHLGLGVLFNGIGLYVQLALLFSVMAVVSATLAIWASFHFLEGWQPVASFVLDFIAAVVAPVVVMMAVATHYRGRVISTFTALGQAIPWVPRYFWTNVHTTLIFWVPVTFAEILQRAQQAWLPLHGFWGGATVLGWWIFIGVVALYMHSRTLLAPYLAIHSNLPGTMAALESWRLSGRDLGPVMATFIVGAAPVGVPLGLLGLLALRTGGVFSQAALPHLVWAGIQLVRPILIPAVYFLYRDLWGQELARRAEVGEPKVPGFARILLALTAWLPPIGPMGQKTFDKETPIQ